MGEGRLLRGESQWSRCERDRNVRRGRGWGRRREGERGGGRYGRWLEGEYEKYGIHGWCVGGAFFCMRMEKYACLGCVRRIGHLYLWVKVMNILQKPLGLKL